MADRTADMADEHQAHAKTGRSAGGFYAGLATGVLATLVVAVAAWLAVVYGGMYNVAATDQHADLVRWTFDTTMHRSVSARADEEPVELPANPSRETLATGASHYADTCVHCHGAPGRDPSEWSRDMRPEAPHLAEAATEWSAGEIHWIVSNGIKMTGMPAFGPRHSREELLALTAFVSVLPGLTPEEYTQFTELSDGHGHGHH